MILSLTSSGLQFSGKLKLSVMVIVGNLGLFWLLVSSIGIALALDNTSANTSEVVKKSKASRQISGTAILNEGAEGTGPLKNPSFGANSSYLIDLKTNTPVDEQRAFQSNLMSDSQILGYKERMMSLERSRKVREDYQLSVTSADQLPQNKAAQNRGFSEEIVKQVGTSAGRGYAKRVRKAAEADPNLRVLKTPVAVIVGAYAYSNGEPVEWQISDKTKMTSRTRVQDTAQQLDFAMPIVNSSFQYEGKVADIAPESALPGSTSERLRLSFSRAIPGVDVQSSLSYGTSSNTMNASLSRPIVIPGLTATIESTRTVGARRLAHESDERVRLNYGVSF